MGARKKDVSPGGKNEIMKSSKLAKVVAWLVIISAAFIGAYYLLFAFGIDCAWSETRNVFHCRTLMPQLWSLFAPLILLSWFSRIIRIYELPSVYRKSIAIFLSVYLIANILLILSAHGSIEGRVFSLFRTTKMGQAFSSSYKSTVGCNSLKGGEEIKYICKTFHKLSGNRGRLLGNPQFCEQIQAVPKEDVHLYFDSPVFQGAQLSGFGDIVTDELVMRSSCYHLYLRMSAEASSYAKPISTRACETINDNDAIRHLCYFKHRRCENIVDSDVVRDDCFALVKALREGKEFLYR